MNTFDEEQLRRALRDEANAFAISDGAIDTILDEARDSDDAGGASRIRSFVAHTGRMRSSVMAVAACVVLLAVAVPLFNSEVSQNNPKTPITVEGSGFIPGAVNV